MLARMSDPAAQGVETLTCSVCGRSSALREAFTHGKDGTLRRTWCPLCASNYQVRMSKLMLIGTVLVLLLGGYNLHEHPDDRVHAFIFGYAAFYLASMLLVLPHEIAHAAVARAVGFTPVGIRAGQGPPLFDREMFGIRVRIGRWPHGGVTHIDMREIPGFKARAIATFAAGGLLHLALAIPALVALPYLTVEATGPLLRWAVLGFGLANLALVIRTFWPRSVKTPLGLMPSDGMLILQRLQNFPIDWGEQKFHVHLLLAAHAYQDRDYAKTILETTQADGCSDQPEHRALSATLRAEALSESGDSRAAIDLLTPYQSRGDLSDALRMHVDQAYAWAVLLSHEPGLLEDALARMELCLKLQPWSDVYVIKYACLLVAAAANDPRRIPEARRLVDSLKEFPLEGESRAYAALARGLVAAAEGQSDVARREQALAEHAGASPTALNVLKRRLTNP